MGALESGTSGDHGADGGGMAGSGGGMAGSGGGDTAMLSMQQQKKS